jgi:hypothetical protein
VALEDVTSVPGKFSEVGETETLGVVLSPIPVRDAVCGLPEALSETLRLPLRAPLAVGVKLTVIPQFAPPARLVPHVFVWLKSPLADTLKMLSAMEPVFVRVACWEALDEPTLVPGKLKEEGNSEALAPGVRPVPVSDAACELPEASSLTVSVPFRAPPAVGVKVTLIVQLEPAPRLAPQVFVCAKSPLAEMPAMFSVALPEFVSVICFPALVVPTF